MILSVDSGDWLIANKSGDAVHAELLKNELESKEIKCFIMNKKDSIYPMFGAYLLYVQKNEVDKAKSIIGEFMKNNDGEAK